MVFFRCGMRMRSFHLPMLRPVLLNLVLQTAAFAQPLTTEFQKSTVDRISELLNQNYVFPDVARSSGKHLESRLAEGTFDELTDLRSFARSLTRELQEVSHDKHLRVRPTDPEGSEQPEADNSRGFRESKVLAGNIGYIDMRGFAPVSLAANVADNHMSVVRDVDALIIDMRRNGGGDPAMVQYMCSYFFTTRIHLNSIYNRIRDSTTEYWTIPVNGKKLPDVPLYVLTSGFTFSGGEEFAYNMQTQKRATLIGETTGGGANPGDRFTINDKLFIFIPTGRAINPITGTNWEGTGVVPEIKLPGDQAFEKAVELAKEAGMKYRKKGGAR